MELGHGEENLSTMLLVRRFFQSCILLFPYPADHWDVRANGAGAWHLRAGPGNDGNVRSRQPAVCGPLADAVQYQVVARR